MTQHSVAAVGWARSLPLSSEPKDARDWTEKHLDKLGWPDAQPDLAFAVLLCVSELVTNSHVHACSPAQLVLSWDGSCLHVTVHDDSPDLPRPRTASGDDEGGRGLQLLEALSETWQARRCPTGKDVVACFRPSQAATR